MDPPASRPDRPPVRGPGRGRGPDAGAPAAPDEPRSGPRAQYAATLRTDHQGRLAGWAVVAVVALVVLLLKPWGGTETENPGRSEPAGARATVPAHSQIASSIAAPSPRVPGICIDVGAWLLTTVELDRERTIRVWRAIDLGTNATGPLDPSIPTTQLRTDGVLDLGWCAPTVGRDASTDSATVDAWAVDGGIATTIALTDPDPSAPPSGYGGLYRPADPGASAWAQGTYVFHHATSDGRDHWFRVRITDKPGVPVAARASGRGPRQR